MVVAVRAVIIRFVYLLYFAVVVLAILGLILVFPYSLGNRTLFTRNEISIQYKHWLGNCYSDPLHLCSALFNSVFP